MFALRLRHCSRTGSLFACAQRLGREAPAVRYSSWHENDKNTAGPLNGIRVLDLSRVLAGPFCTQILADYGADVIKVEQPGNGDDTRHWTAKGESAKWQSVSPMSLYFCSVNRNKRSLTLDLKKAEARKILLKLAKSSDVFVENFIPGKAEELGVGYAEVSAVNPSIVYASISGYGSSGPFARRAGYDGIAAAEGGLMHITGEPGRAPVRPGLGMVDMATGLYMHGAILAALRERDRSGTGQKVDASLFETQISLLINVGINWLNLGLEGQRYGSAHPSIVPYNTFQTKDGWFALGANNQRQWKILCERIGREHWLSDERFATNPKRVENRAAMEDDLEAILRQRTNQEWDKVLEGSGLPYGPVNSIEKAFSHPQIEPRNMVVSERADMFGDGDLKMIGPAVKFSGSKSYATSIAPTLGQHNGEILNELGYTAKGIARLQETGVT